MRSWFLLTLLATGFLAISARATEVRWAANGHYYEAVYSPGMTWDAAEAASVARGGHLATITSAAEDNFVKSLFENNPVLWYIDAYNNALGPWIGGFQSDCVPEPGCGWGWVTGESMAYTGWASNQPDNCCNLNQNRIEYYRWNNAPPTGWDDVQHFATELRGYICERCPTAYPFAIGSDGQMVISTTSPTTCFGPSSGVFKPRIDPCGVLHRTSGAQIRYGFVTTDGTLMIPNVSLTVRVETVSNTGGHLHWESRPEPQPSIQGPSTTGGDGRSFVVSHTWPEDAREMAVYVYGTDGHCNYGSSTTPAFRYCIRESVYGQLPASSTYERTSATDLTHPERYGGTAGTIAALQAVAAAWDPVYGSLAKLGYNDLSLPWGGLYDYHQTWHPPHCSHRSGLNCDVRTNNTWIPAQGMLLIDRLWYALSAQHFNVYEEDNHYHVTYQEGGSRDFAGFPDTVGAVTWGGAVRQEIGSHVSVEVTRNPTTGWYTYYYTVRNTFAGGDSIDVFAVRAAGECVVTSPDHWSGSRGFRDDSTSVVWACTDPGPPPEGWVFTGANRYTSRYAIAPGDSVTGFILTSPCEPESLQYNTRLLGDVPEAESETPEVPFWAVGDSGRTMGPMDCDVSGVTPKPPEHGALQPVESGAAPNPFAISTTVYYNVPDAGSVSVEIIDAGGRIVRSIFDGMRPAGRYAATWDRRSEAGEVLPSGIYFCRVKRLNAQANIKLIVVN
jgi:hypothetical protein